MYATIAAISATAIVISLFIETTSWWIKTFCSPNRIGLFVARTNIYLYGSRLFSLVFSSGVAAYVEAGHSRWTVALLLSASFLVAFATQVALINRSPTGIRMIRFLARIMMIGDLENVDFESAVVPNRRLTLATAAGTYIFGLGIGLPLLFASLVPQHRLVISYSGQLINFAGSLTVIMFVDQTLFRSMDSGNIRHDVVAFTLGRYFGLLAVFATFGAVAALLYFGR